MGKIESTPATKIDPEITETPQAPEAIESNVLAGLPPEVIALIDKLVSARVDEEIQKAKKSSQSIPEVDSEDELKKTKELKRKKAEEYLNERVPIRLMKDNDKYKDDVTVHHNGYCIQIERGKTVMIPRKAAMILEQSLTQDEKTAMMIEQKSAAFAMEAAKL